MNEAVSTTVGVLLAAGRGRRMGQFKQLLPWAGSTVVAAAFDALACHCGAGMVLVLGDDADLIIEALAHRTFHRADSDSDAEQVDSAFLGLQCAVRIPGVQRVLVHPADHPLIGKSVIETMLRHVAERTRVLIPTYRGRGGHPVLIPADIVESIIAWHGGNACPHTGETSGGLRGYWELHPQQVQRIEFPDAPELVVDLDTPGDYAAALRRIS